MAFKDMIEKSLQRRQEAARARTLAEKTKEVEITAADVNGTIIEHKIDMPFTSKDAYVYYQTSDVPREGMERPTAITEEATMLVGWKWPLAETETEAEHIEFLYNDPVGFWEAVKGAWAGLRTTQEKADYLGLINQWVHKHMAGYIHPQLNANYYPEMLNALPLPLMGWVTENVLDDAIGHYWIQWMSADPRGFITTVKSTWDRLPVEQRPGYIEAIRSGTAWWVNEIAGTGQLAPLFNQIPPAYIVFTTHDLYPEHIEYGKLRWINESPEWWANTQMEIMDTLDENEKISFIEDIQYFLSDERVNRDFLEKLVPKQRNQFIETFLPEAKDMKASDYDIAAFNMGKAAKFGGLLLFGGFALWGISKLIPEKKRDGGIPKGR